jgi:hypothetical protein
MISTEHNSRNVCTPRCGSSNGSVEHLSVEAATSRHLVGEADIYLEKEGNNEYCRRQFAAFCLAYT